MEILFLIVAVCLSFVGLVGSVVPALPGAPLNFIAIVILYFLKPGLIGDGTLIFFGALTVVAVFADYILPAIKAKKFGATRYGVLGFFIGMVFGFMALAFAGMMIGAVLGAILGELISGKRPESALGSGLAVIWGIALAMAIKFTIASVMAIYFFIKLISLAF
ncbi:MAG: hypothetical protein US71_C0023G0002 [Parcubacteria group bacterium GW2011_GWD2_38_12]|nr:MAG: hypothetical protein US06_C0022G0002 [Parcubacteria group bacterium GW2011_GWC2_36_17]KKQ50913.1 MAG: hypothetical protein US71_C0023G0002 [Parcubacteria group bacterium GW2011_GWD2_38_12]